MKKKNKFFASGTFPWRPFFVFFISFVLDSLNNKGFSFIFVPIHYKIFTYKTFTMAPKFINFAKIVFIRANLILLILKHFAFKFLHLVLEKLIIFYMKEVMHNTKFAHLSHLCDGNFWLSSKYALPPPISYLQDLRPHCTVHTNVMQVYISHSNFLIHYFRLSMLLLRRK